MLTCYNLFFKNLSLRLTYDDTIKIESGNINSFGIGASLAIFDVHNFYDRMGVDPSLFSEKCKNEKFSIINGGIGSFSNSNKKAFLGQENVIKSRDSISKAMLIAILNGDSKRTVGIGTSSLSEKRQMFYNTLILDEYKDYTIKPWNNWNNPVGVCTPVYVSRSNNVAIVTTSPAHGMTTAYDDWGVIMNLNTGIATSFNISTSTYPNGVPVKIINQTTFSYQNVGINTSTISVTGISSIQVGWGGSSNNLHLYFT